MTTVFWWSVGLIIYTYFGYYGLLRLLVGIASRPVIIDAIEPAITVVIPVYNGEHIIQAKLDNLCAVDYPNEQMEVFVVSDGSTDGTNDVVAGYPDTRVHLIALSERQGKETAQQAALEQATGDVCVFTDATTELEPESLRRIIEPFADPAVGSVTSYDITDPDSGEGAYIRYDMALRQMESSIGSTTGMTGAFFAVRRSLCAGWPSDVPSDFYMLLMTVLRGYRGVLRAEARGIYTSKRSTGGEFQRKVRTIQRGIACLMRAPSVLLPWRVGLFSLQVLSHKLLRWAVPFFMIAALVSNAFLLDGTLYRLLFVGQLAFYAVALAALIAPALQQRLILRLPSFFLLTNASIAVAWWRYLRHGTVKTWQPTAR